MGKNPKALSIVIAEDDEDDYLLTMEALKEAGVENPVHWVKDGDELLKFLNNHPQQAVENAGPTGIILLDLNMPRKDGRETLEEIKKNPEFRKIPVIVMTTSKAESDIIHSYDLGVNSFIQKPVRFYDFVEMIKIVTVYWLETVKLPF